MVYDNCMKEVGFAEEMTDRFDMKVRLLRDQLDHLLAVLMDKFIHENRQESLWNIMFAICDFHMSG